MSNIIIRIYEKTIFTPCWRNNQNLFNCSSTFDRRDDPRLCGLAGTVGSSSPFNFIPRLFFIAQKFFRA